MAASGSQQASTKPVAQSTPNVVTAAKGPLRPAILVRCPQCGKAFERTEHVLQVCPNCGFRAPTVPPEERIMPEGVVGKPRHAWAVFLLTFVLQAVFWPLYLLLAFRPLDKQHGRNHNVVAWSFSWVPFLGVFLAIPYAWQGLVRLQRSRRARGLRKGIGPFWFILVATVTPLAALGYVATWQGFDASEGAFGFKGAFDAGRLVDWDLYGTTLANVGVSAVALAVWSLGPAIALAIAMSSANRLWREIYFERGEAWPWREGVAG